MKYIALYLFLTLSVQLLAQKSIKLSWGPFYSELDDNSKVYFLGFSHKDSTHILIINEALDLVEYNYNLEQVYKSSLKKVLKSNNIGGVYKKGDDTYILSVNGKGEHYIQKYDTAHYTLKDEKLLFTSELGIGLNLKYSPDSSKVLFYNMINDKDGNKIEFVVFNESLRYRWQKTIMVQKATKYFHEPVISNEGDVFYCDTDGKYLLINGITKGGDDFFQKTVILKSSNYLDPVLLMNKGHLFVVQGHKKDNVQFDCVTDIDVLEYSTNGEKLAEYNYAFEECLKNLQITHLHILSDGDILIVSELLSTREGTSSNQVQYGSLQVMRFDLETDSVVWEQEIFKNHYYVTTPDKFAYQHTDEYRLLHDHKMYEYNGELLFVYNDNCSNCMTNSIGVKPKSQSNMKSSCLNMVSINADGKVIRNIYSGRINVKYYVMMNNVIRISNNRVVVWAVNQGFRLGRLHLD